MSEVQKQEAKDYLVSTYRRATQKEIDVEVMNFLVDDLAAKPAESDKYENALVEKVAEIKASSNEMQAVKALYDQAVHTLPLVKRKEEFITDVSVNYDEEDESLEQAQVTAGKLFDQIVTESNPEQTGQHLQVLSAITNIEDDADRAQSVKGMLEFYEEESAKEDFNIDGFVRNLYQEYIAYAEMKKDQQLDAIIDKYYEGDKDAAKEAKSVFQPHEKLQLIAFMNNMEEQEDTLDDDKKAEFVSAFNSGFDDAIEAANHNKVMDPLAQEFQELLEENYQGEKTPETQAMMSVLATPFFGDSIMNNIKEEKKEAARAVAQESGEEFDDTAFEASYAQPTAAEIEDEAADLVRRMKEDVAPEDLQAGLTQGYDEFVEKAMAPEPEVGQKFKPTIGAKLANGLITVVGAGGAGMAARAAFAYAATSTGLAGAAVTATGILGLVGLGVAGGAFAGYVGYSAARAINAHVKTKREFKQQQPNASYVKSRIFDSNVKEAYAKNFAATKNRKSMLFSMALGGVIGGVVAGWGEQIFDAASEAWNNSNAGTAVTQAGSGFWDTITGWLPGGDVAADASLVAELSPGDAHMNSELGLIPSDAESTVAAQDAATDAIDAHLDSELGLISPEAGADAAPAVDPAATVDPAAAADPTTTAEFTMPTSVDADLKALIIEAAQQNDVTSYEAGIIDRLESGTIGQQVQAAKDASLLFGGDLQMTILEALDEQFGNISNCEGAVIEPQLERAIGQVNADLGILQLQDAMQAEMVDATDNASLNEAIVNLLQGAEAGNAHAANALSAAQECFPQAFDAAQSAYADLTCDVTPADGGAVAPEAAAETPDLEAVLCDDDVVIPEMDGLFDADVSEPEAPAEPAAVTPIEPAAPVEPAEVTPVETVVPTEPAVEAVEPAPVATGELEAVLCDEDTVLPGMTEALASLEDALGLDGDASSVLPPEAASEIPEIAAAIETNTGFNEAVAAVDATTAEAAPAAVNDDVSRGIANAARAFQGFKLS